jgi:radical SAM protein with 4Fe4S-binding SPASM domain
MQKTNIFTLSPHHLIQKGYSRCAIFDKKHGLHWFLPNEWGETLMNPAGFLVDDLILKTPSLSQEEIQSDLAFLKRNGIINLKEDYVPTEPMAPIKISNYFITNCSVNIHKTIAHEFISELKTTRIKTLELHFLQYTNIEQCIKAFRDLNFTSLEIFLNYANFKEFNMNELIRKTAKLTAIHICNTPFSYSEIYKRVLIKKTKAYNNHEFNLKLLQQQENKHIHLYYNGRVHIDACGTITNSPQSTKGFGNILNDNIDKIVRSKAFQEVWLAHKKQIDVCRDCELRAICIDRRPLIKRKDATWYSKETCSYNPYLGAFKGEPNYKQLDECGIESNQQGFKILVDQFIEVKMNNTNAALNLDSGLNLF